MKVTVCFGSTKVIVPCGNGDLLVSDLVEQAVTRYKKAIKKTSDYWVTVHSLKSSSDGGILDPDDKLKDVVDDKEQILALYEEQDAPPIPHNGGDGTSASSVGTSSPDIFQGGQYNNNKDYNNYLRRANKDDVIITQNDLNAVHTGSSLVVRRGSEPALTKLITDDSESIRPHFYPPKSCIKRWSAIASIDKTKSPQESEADDEHESDTPPPTLERVGGIGQEEDQTSRNSSFSTFSRGSSRRSLANNAAMLKWLEAQERAQEQYEVKPGRCEPLGGRAEEEEVSHDSKTAQAHGKQSQLVILENSAGPLGIHVIPELDATGRARGLLIQSVEDGGRIHKDGRIRQDDVITEINGTSLAGVDFAKAQEIFRQALNADSLRLRVIKAPPPLPEHPPPDDKPLSPITGDKSIPSGKISAPSTPAKLEIKTSETAIHEQTGKSAVSPAKGPPPPVPARNPNTALSSSRFVATNTRKIGKKINIQLTKGPQGLGFSVTTRDNPTGGHAPIYIKKILPKGAAIEDGNLKPGDRLLEVNGIEMTGKSQTEAVTVLRNTKMGSVVNIVVSRQVLEGEENMTQEESKTVQKLQSENQVDHDNLGTAREVLGIDIPMDDAEGTGLGLNVKGKTVTTEDGVKDTGIFIKAIIPNGAAAKDGRIKVNDQLIEVNGEQLFGKSNPEAMEILRNAVQKGSKKSGFIHLVVSRKHPMDCSSVSSINEARISHSDNVVAAESHDKEQDGSSKSAGNAVAKKIDQRLARVKREQSLRNVSYQIATNDSLANDTVDSVFIEPQQKPASFGLAVAAKNVTNAEGSSMLIHADSPVRMRSNSSSSGTRVRPASTLGFRTSESDSRMQLSVSRSNQDLLDSESKWLKEWDKSDDVVDDEKSPVDDVDPATVFRREGFGRQSMSEKRKGHIDPRMIEFYQKIKSNKESGSSQFISASWDPRRSAFQQIEVNPDEVGPVLGLKKSSSLESLQMVVQDEENAAAGKKAHRGRGCNESFRAAVDRSYEQAGEAMETVEEEGSDIGSVSQETRSRASSVSGHETEKHGKKSKKDKEKGLFKNFFKLGKSKKSESKMKSAEELREKNGSKSSSEHKASGSHQHQSDQNHITMETKNLVDQQHHQQREEQFRKEQPFHRPSSPPHLPPASRTDRIQQLRLEHQRRHRERHGQYPLDAEEERHIQELERQRNASESNHYNIYQLPPRQLYDESMKYERARLAYADGEHYNHYQNLQEIQAQLREHDFYQHRYHHPPTSGYVPGHYTREVKMPPPLPSSERRYNHRPYGEMPPPHDPHADVYHYNSYYVPHHPAYRTVTPSPAPHLHTPANQSAYISHPVLGRPTPQLIINPPAQDHMRQRVYSDFETERRPIYREPPYGSLPRRRERKDIPGSAQV